VNSKQEQYAALVARRKRCHLCSGMTNPADVAGGAFDSDQIGPWSRWQSNLDAELMIVGQDWEERSYFIKEEGWDGDKHQSNRRLGELLRSIGVSISSAGDAPEPQVVFLTNAVLCLKDGGSSAEVPSRYFANCRSFLKDQVELVSPKVVVGFGRPAFESAYGKTPPLFSSAVLDQRGILLSGRTRVFAVYHCSNRRFGMTDQRFHWKRIAAALSTSPTA
jgi:uracil-DNA glycosylase